MEPVSFITAEVNNFLILSFVIEDRAGEGKSLILMRSPRSEFVFEDHERGVNVSHEDLPERDDELLKRISLGSDVVTIESTYNRYELDVSRVDKRELEKAHAILRQMNFDERFTIDFV